MRILRQNKELNDPIEALDLHLQNCKGDFYEAWNNLDSHGLQFVAREISRCRSSLAYYLQNYHVINNAITRELSAVFPLWDSQYMILDKVTPARRENRALRLLILKARQQSASTTTQGIDFSMTIFNRNTDTLVISWCPSHAEYLFSMSKLAFLNLPWWMQPEVQYEAKQYLVFNNKDPHADYFVKGLNSSIRVDSASREFGAISMGRTPKLVHLCLAPNAIIRTRNGVPKLIKELTTDDYVLTSKGRIAKVKALCKSTRRNELTSEINLWGNFSPLSCTRDHLVLTEKGFMPAGNLSSGDFVLYPVREIRECLKSFKVVSRKTGRAGDIQHKGTTEQEIPLSREWGWFLGLYLAEGSMGHTAGKLDELALHSTIFSIDKDEVEGFLGRIKSCQGLPTEPRLGRLTSRTRIIGIDHSGLARWVSANFGMKDSKTVPDWAWEAGREFCLGILQGYIEGDGHYVPSCNEVYVSSVRLQIHSQIRELAASLGFGWPSIHYREGGNYYGRNCRDIWIMSFHGNNCAQMRQAFGVPTFPLNGQNKWHYTQDGKFIAIPVESNMDGYAEAFYDIEVEAEEHDFCTIQCCVHNSEISNFPDPSTLTRGLFPALHGKVIVIAESTANGYKNYMYDFWKDCQSGDTEMEWETLFIPDYAVNYHFIEIEEGDKFTLTKQEVDIQKQAKETYEIEVPDGYFKWRRGAIREVIATEGSDEGFYEQHPVTPEEAFQSSGDCPFPKAKLREILVRDCRPPEFVGEIDLDPRDNRTVKLSLQQWTPETPQNSKRTGTRLAIWERPLGGHKYYVGSDIAEGVQLDFSCAEVWKLGDGVVPDEQVAEWHGWINPLRFAWVMAALGYWYNGADVAPEANDVGRIVIGELFRGLMYPNWYIWKHPDKRRGIMTNFLGWKTQWNNVGTLNQKLSYSIQEDSLILRSSELVREMLHFTRNENSGRYSGAQGEDDRVSAARITNYCAHDLDVYNRGQQGAGYPQAPTVPGAESSWPMVVMEQGPDGKMHRRVVNGIPLPAGYGPESRQRFIEELMLFDNESSATRSTSRKEESASDPWVTGGDGWSDNEHIN